MTYPDRTAGCVVNIIVAMLATKPAPSSTVPGAPIIVISPPAGKSPSGRMPMSAQVFMPITRPRMSCGTRD